MNRSGWRALTGQVIQIILTLILALLMGAIVMTVCGKDALEAYQVLFKSAFGGKTAIANTLLAATPLILSGLGAALAFRAGIFNVGVEGSIYIGAFTAAWVGFTFLELPGYLLIPAAFIAAVITGGIWCYLPGILKGRLNVDEIVTTIMLNYVAVMFTSYLVNYPFRVPGLANAMSAAISENAYLVRLAPPSQLNSSFILAVVIAIAAAFLVKRMKLGYELRSVGDNPIFARWSGIPVPAVIEKVMFLSGAMGGIAGAAQVMGVNYRFIAGFSPGMGFTGIAIALLARNNPIGVLIAALLFGALRSGSATMELFTDVPFDLIRVLEATVIFFAAVEFSFGWIRKRKHGTTD